MKKVLYACITFAMGAGLSASTVYNTGADLTGTRAIGSGLALGGGEGYAGLTLTWEIAPLVDGTFDYSYTLTGFTTPDIGHFILELSSNCIVSGASCVSNARINGRRVTPVLGDYCDGCEGNSNTGLPNHIVGMKVANPFSGSPITFSFNSPQVPVWGDFYLKGGQQFVYNLGNLDHADPLRLDFVARPDGAELVPQIAAPEPASLGLTGAALLLLGLSSVRKKPVRPV